MTVIWSENECLNKVDHVFESIAAQRNPWDSEKWVLVREGQTCQ